MLVVCEREESIGITYAPAKSVTVTNYDNGEGSLNLATVWSENSSVFVNSVNTGSLPSAGNVNWFNVVLSLMIAGFLLKVGYSLSKRKKQ